MIQSLKRTFDILEYIAANGNLVRVIDIAQALKVRNNNLFAKPINVRLIFLLNILNNATNHILFLIRKK